MAYEELAPLTGRVIGAALKVHKELGPGFSERIYSKCLQREMQEQRIQFSAEHSVPISYKGQKLGSHRLDFLVEGVLAVEIKSVNGTSQAPIAQMLSYLRSSKRKLGLIFNFGKPKLEIKRVVL